MQHRAAGVAVRSQDEGDRRGAEARSLADRMACRKQFACERDDGRRVDNAPSSRK